MVAVVIKRTDFTAATLRAAAVCADDPGVTWRALAIAMVLDGYSRATAAERAGMDRQTLRDWVHRFNAEGLEGLSDRPRPGRLAFLSAAQMKEVEGWVEAGPDLKTDGVVRWHRIDLVDRIKAKFNVRLDVRTVGRLLRALDFRRLSVRPQHPEGDDAAQEAFKKDFPERAVAAIPAPARGKPVEIWWQDEARVGQQGTLTRIWTRRGTRPRAVLAQFTETQDPQQHRAVAAAAYAPELKPGRKYLGVPARQLPQPPCLRQLRGAYSGLRRCVEHAHETAANHRLDRNPALGTGQNLRALV